RGSLTHGGSYALPYYTSALRSAIQGSSPLRQLHRSSHRRLVKISIQWVARRIPDSRDLRRAVRFRLRSWRAQSSRHTCARIFGQENGDRSSNFTQRLSTGTDVQDTGLLDEARHSWSARVATAKHRTN